MDVGVICLDPDVTSISIEGQQFDVYAGRMPNGERAQVAVVPVALAAKLASFPHRYKLVPIPENVSRQSQDAREPLVLNREGFLGTQTDNGREKTRDELTGSGPTPGQSNQPGNLNPTRSDSGRGPDTITSQLTGPDTGLEKTAEAKAEADAKASADADAAAKAEADAKADADTKGKGKGKDK